MRFSTIDMGAANPRIEQIRAALAAPGLADLLDRMLDGVIVVDGGGVIAINAAATDINKLRREAVVGSPFEVLKEHSDLDWAALAERPSDQRRREFISQTKDGRSILTSLRHMRNDAGEVELMLIFQRDLRVFDHLRRTAAGGGGNVFKFLADREIVPNYDAQRRISRPIDNMIEVGARAVRQGARLLLVGESGTGKTEFTKYLHRMVGTAEEPFVQVNCGAVPESLFESEMFGYEKGAFTGALQSGKKGLIESAEGGTLFLDEIGEIPLHSQAKLLKFLEDGVVQRVGGRAGRKVRARVISATNRDLWALVSDGRFRRDLYYRLAVITLELAPLRDQPALIEHLVDHFAGAANQMRSPALQIAPDCRARLRAYDFPGNIRELHNLIQHLSVVAGDEAEAGHLPPHVLRPGGAAAGDPEPAAKAPRRPLGDTQPCTRPLKEQVRSYERDLIESAIRRCGSKRKAAQALGVDIGTIVRKTRREGSE
jgi:transcriptional regulator with PAS, ATPase and Fis domain